MGCTTSKTSTVSGSRSFLKTKKKHPTMQKASSQRDIHNRWSHWDETFDPITGEELAPLPKKQHRASSTGHHKPGKRSKQPTSSRSSSAFSSLSNASSSHSINSMISGSNASSSTDDMPGIALHNKHVPNKANKQQNIATLDISPNKAQTTTSSSTAISTNNPQGFIAAIASTSSNTITSLSSSESLSRKLSMEEDIAATGTD